MYTGLSQLNKTNMFTKNICTLYTVPAGPRGEKPSHLVINNSDIFFMSFTLLALFRNT